MLATWRDVINTGLAAACSRYLPTSDEVGAASRYSVLGDGKRLRGLLCLAIAADLGAHIDERSPLFDLAVALEVIHAASLIHDDLPALDNDDFRRGKPSCHRAFSESTAILAGDALVGVAFSVIGGSASSEYQRVHATCVISDAWIKLCRGQVLDLITNGKTVSRAVMELKTGALFAAAAGCGASALVEGSVVKIWSKWGLEIGVLFQRIDDLLDGEGDELERERVVQDIQASVVFLREQLLGLETCRESNFTEEVLALFIPQELQRLQRPAM